MLDLPPESAGPRGFFVIGSAMQRVGEATIGVLDDTGEMWRLATATVRRFGADVLSRRLRFEASLLQLIRAGNRSLPLVALLCTLVGMIMALQGAYQLEKMGATNLVPALVAITVVRELAPLLVAIIVTGRVGSAIAAELGSMRVSQELDALTVMGLDPIGYLVVPRCLALLIAMPCLTVFADIVAILGGMFVGTTILGMGLPNYGLLTLDALQLQDVFTGLVKSTFFALIIGLVACHQGLTTRGGAVGVGQATTTSVVRSILLTILADLFVTAWFFVRGA